MQESHRASTLMDGTVVSWMVSVCTVWLLLDSSQFIILCAVAARSMMRLPVQISSRRPNCRYEIFFSDGTSHQGTVLKRKVSGPLGVSRCLGFVAANVYGVTWMPWVGCNTAFILCFASTLPRPTVVIREEEKLKTTSLSIALDGGILLDPEF